MIISQKHTHYHHCDKPFPLSTPPSNKEHCSSCHSCASSTIIRRALPPVRVKSHKQHAKPLLHLIDKSGSILQRPGQSRSRIDTDLVRGVIKLRPRRSKSTRKDPVSSTRHKNQRRRSIIPIGTCSSWTLPVGNHSNCANTIRTRHKQTGHESNHHRGCGQKTPRRNAEAFKEKASLLELIPDPDVIQAGST